MYISFTNIFQNMSNQKTVAGQYVVIRYTVMKHGLPMHETWDELTVAINKESIEDLQVILLRKCWFIERVYVVITNAFVKGRQWKKDKT